MAASSAAACAFGPTGTHFSHDDDASVPNLMVDAGVAPKCVNLECNRSSCPDGRHTTLSGTVFDPAGQTPLYNAIVYVPNSPVAPFTQGVSCDRCGSLASGDPIVVALTDEQGRFVLDDVPVTEDLPLVIQMGHWRRIVHVEQVLGCQDNPVSPTSTHLPRNRHEGDIPRFAVVTGGFDPLECLLRKIGIDDAEFTGASGDGRVHLYEGYNGGGVPTSEPSTRLYPQIQRYDAVLLACEGDTHPENKSIDATYQMLDYLNQGGRVYASHFQYYWFAPFPDGAGVPPLPQTAAWDTRASLEETIEGVVDVSFPKGKAYYDWLSVVGALDQRGRLTVQQSRHDVDHAIARLSTSWLATDPTSTVPAAVELLTFNTPVHAEPSAQCGRVVFSDMHVASADNTGQPFPTGCVTKGLSAQEKALEFMLFDLSSCIQEDSVPPVPPPAMTLK